MSVIPDSVIQACYEKATENRGLENRVSTIFLNVYQNAGIEKDDDSEQYQTRKSTVAMTCNVS